MSRAELLRPLADAPCPNSVPKIIEYGIEVVCIGGKLSMDGQGHLPDDTCHGTGLDPRFAALRSEHEWLLANEGRVPLCRLCNEYQGSHAIRAYCLRTDLGALARVAAACGLFVTMGVYSKDSGFYEVALSKFFESEGKWTADALEPEDAFAAALVAALPELAS